MFSFGFIDLFIIFSLVGFGLLIIYAITRGGENKPTWEGIILSAVLGLLGLYLILCYFGYMGEEKDNDI